MLQKADIIFYQTLYIIWKLALYYADFMHYEAPENVLKLRTQLTHTEECTFIRVEFPAYGTYDCRDMKEILQEYLAIVLLPESGIPPYYDGETVVESLYLFDTHYNLYDNGKLKRKLIWDFLYINNKESYKLYKEERKK